MTLSIAGPGFLRLSELSDDENRMLGEITNRLSSVHGANKAAADYYEGKQVAEQYGIAIPPSMKDATTVAGWGGTVVDVLEERLDWLGWTTPDESDLGLSQVFSDNNLDVDSGAAHLDALIFGLDFVSVGSGVDGEPSPLVTPHSPQSMTGLWDGRSRRLRAAGAVESADGQMVSATLYLPNQTVRVERRPDGVVVVDRDEHKLGRVPVVLMANRGRTSRETGRSEITRAVRYYTDSAVRTLLGMEVSREFYNSPKLAALNVSEDMFRNSDGTKVGQWEAILGRIWAAPPNEPGEAEPKLVNIPAASPAPYIDQIKTYAQLLAAEAGIPGAYLGFHTDNPSSADAIRAGEARLVKRAERRQSAFGRAWLEVARLALLVRDGGVPPEFSNVGVKWRDAATPTRAAAADEAVKLVSAGVLPPDSTVTYDRIGLSEQEQRRVDADKRRAGGTAALRAIQSAAERGRGVVTGGSTGAGNNAAG